MANDRSDAKDNEDRARGRRYAKLIARAWADEKFKDQLKVDPTQGFAEYGIEIPAGLSVIVVENTEHQMHFIIPPKPASIGQVNLPIHILDCPCSHSNDSHNCGMCRECFNTCD